MTETSAMASRPWAMVTAVLGSAMLAVYVSLVVSEGGNTTLYILPWAVLMATAAAISLAAVFVREPPTARRLLIGAAAVYGALGLAAILSIGLGFLLAAAAAVMAILRLPRETR